MPKPVRYTEITDFTPYDAGTTQVLNTCRFEGLDWFFKQPPALIVDARARMLRILNEAICGAIVFSLSERARYSFLTPVHRLVINDLGSPVGLLSQKISYQTFMDRGTGKSGLELVLGMSGLAEISTARFCIGDPDGNNNAGYGESSRLSSIDYGLANYPYLFAQDALTEIEKRRLPLDRGLGTFNITVDNVLSFILQPVGDDVEFMAHHVFPRFELFLAEFCETNKELVEGFFSKVYKMLNVVSMEITADGFKEGVFETLGLTGLNDKDRIICHNIIDVLVDRAHHLKETLRTISGYSPIAFTRHLDESVSEKRLSPVMRSVFPACKREILVDVINEIMLSRAETERSVGRITPANGGGAQGYRDVLFPIIPKSPLRTSRAGSIDDYLNISPEGSPSRWS